MVDEYAVHNARPVACSITNSFVNVLLSFLKKKLMLILLEPQWEIKCSPVSLPDVRRKYFGRSGRSTSG